ncbi:conserved hypothetical protein [Trichinella spiralis]|uniref:hypothetical protein n=1 Tax=Trichinella spiralis TaxID=6334 RepID=UPI0001EFDD38|nr:conserved hypothetical protein [Trichinella spiralis]
MNVNSGRLHIILIMQIAIVSLQVSEKIGSYCGRWNTVTDDRHLYVLKWTED